MRKNVSSLKMALAAAACGIGQVAWAAGYQINLQGVRAQGSSNAASAEAADPSTIFYNPAGLTRLDGTRLVIGGTVVDPHSSFSYSTATNGSNQPILNGGTGGDFVKQSVIPRGYLSHQFNERMTVGVGVFVPYGAAIEYDDDFVGRYYGHKIDFKSVTINPSLGYRMNERHSVGLGISAQYLGFTLDKKLDLAPVAFGVCLAGGGAQTDCSNAASAYDGLPDANGEIVTGSDWEYGFNLGYLFTPSDDTRIGLAYRSHVGHELEASTNFTIPDNLPGGAAFPLNVGIQVALADSDSTIDLTTPETVSLNAYHQLNERWAIMGDVTWSRQSRLQQVEIKMPTAQIPDRKITFKTAWANTWRASIGASYQLGEEWTVRGGYMYDRVPLTDSRYGLTILPDADRQMFSLGASYRINGQNSLDFAYSHLKFKDAAINRTDDDYISNNGSPGVLRGTYSTYINVFGLSYSYTF